jgi:UDP-N-acetylglucosamine 1-carboxyvinyltransferase
VDKFIIDGPSRLKGEVAIAGAKNAALPCLAATLLTAGPVRLTNLPPVADVRTMRKVLAHIGARVEAGGDSATIEVPEIVHADAPYELVKTMRASVLVLGPLLARAGSVRVSLHHGYVEAKATRLTGADVAFETVTVTGTENAMLAATLSSGTSRLFNAAREPEVVDLARLLVAMGARIDGAGTGTISIEGVDALHGADHEVVPDRIEAGTYANAAAATRGDVAVRGCRPGHLKALTTRLAATGASVDIETDALRVRAAGDLAAQDVATAAYPGFPTDLQAQWTALATGLDGVSTITETIFENRFHHVAELVRMGARIRLEGRWAVVEGGRLTGANVMASDLRASAALAIAGLTAEGPTTIERVYHLDRGYARMEEKLKALGASVTRVSGGGV